MKKIQFLTFTLLLIFTLFLPIRVATAKLKATLEGHTDNVWSVAFSPNGKMLASASWDQTVRLWNVDTEQLLHTLTEHTNEVLSVAFSPDGQTLASASWDGTIRLWDPNTGKLKRTLTEHEGGVGSVAFSPDGKVLVSGSADQTVRLWNAKTWKLERTLTGHTHIVDSVAFSPNGNMLASGSRDQTIRLWNLHTEKRIEPLIGHTGDILRMMFSPDGETLVSGSRDQTVRLWNPNTGEDKRTLTNPSGWTNSVAFSPDGATLLIGGRGISVWDTQTEEYKTPFAGNIGTALCVIFSPDGQMVASGSEDNKVYLWDFTRYVPNVPFVNIPFDINNIPEPAPPPAAVQDFFQLDPFYQQWISVEGFPVVASTNVSPYALKEAAWLIWQMSRHHPDLLQVMAQNQIRFSITAHNEMSSDIPELKEYLVPHFYYNVRGRGGTCPFRCGIVSDSEEQLLGSHTYSVLIHEFAHVIHKVANIVDPEFDNRLRTTYNAAMEKGLWSGTYAASNRDEYWADGVGSWFHAIEHNTVNTRSDLKTYDPGLANLLTEIFGDGAWRYTPITMRTHLQHLDGFDPQSAPQLKRPPGTLETYEELYNPAINERNEWVNLPPYDPSLISILNESRIREDTTDILFVNLSGAEVLLYRVSPSGTETLANRFPPNPRLITQFTIEVGGLLLAKDSTGRNLAVFQAVEKVGRALVAPTLHLITPGLSKTLGNNQKGLSGTALANPFVIEVRDENLSELEGISVTFTVTVGHGSLSVTHTTTDENGRAESTLTLGPNPGTNTVSVSAVGIEHPVIFNATAETPIDIPDPNLRDAIETALGVASGARIVSSQMENLTRLEAKNANISDLTGLEYATNLTFLWLENNEISDISPVTGLNKLTRLDFGNNNISDISPVTGLNNLTSLWLWENSISDISPVTGLTNLTRLGLWNNSIADISPLVANTGLGSGDEIYMRGNPLNYLSIHTHIPILQSKGITVKFDNQTLTMLPKKTTGPWLWMIAPTEPGRGGADSTDVDSLANASGGNVTETDVAANGAREGDAVGNYVWTLGEISPTGDDNVNNLLNKIGLSSGDVDDHSSYALITLESAMAQPDVTIRVGSDDSIKVWLNGEVVHNNPVNRGAEDFQDTFKVNLVAGDNLLLVKVSERTEGWSMFVGIEADMNAAYKRPPDPVVSEDVNGDGVVNILDLVSVSANFGKTGQNPADVNGDGVVNIVDLVKVAGEMGAGAAAPSAHPQTLEILTVSDVQQWLTQAQHLDLTDASSQRGILTLEQLLAALIPEKTSLLPNYPNPFNPETWIPYQLSEPAEVTLHIYAVDGTLIRTLTLGHQFAGMYQSKSRAAFWDGKNMVGEPVASGVYFYTFTAGDFTATRKMLIRK